MSPPRCLNTCASLTLFLGIISSTIERYTPGIGALAMVVRFSLCSMPSSDVPLPRFVNGSVRGIGFSSPRITASILDR